MCGQAVRVAKLCSLRGKQTKLGGWLQHGFQGRQPNAGNKKQTRVIRIVAGEIRISNHTVETDQTEERYIAWLRGDAPRGAMGPYIHIDENDVRKSYLAHIPRLGV